jgi:signal transduction histidine kinase/CHASE3 domain sensor protein
VSADGTHPRTLTRQIVVAGVVLGLLQIAVFVVLIGAVRSADEASRRAGEILLTSQTVAELEKQVIDTETGMRGFVITGRDEFLQPADAARVRIPELERRARERLTGPGERALLDRLVRDISSYETGWLDRVVAAAGRSLDAGRRLVATGEGRRRVDRMRAMFTAIRNGLRADAAEDERSTRAAVRRAVAISGAGILLSGLLFTLFTLYVGRSVVIPVRRVALTARRLAGGDRTARVRVADTSGGELAAMARSFNQMAETLAESHDELEAQQHEVTAYSEELEMQRGELEDAVGALEAEKGRVERISAFGEAIAAETAFAPLAGLILGGIADAVDCDVGVLYVRDALRDNQLAVATTRGVEPSRVADILEIGEGLAGRAAAERTAVTASDSGDGPVVAALAGPARVRHELHVPLVQAGEVFGVLSVGRLADEPFEQPDIGLVTHLAGQSAVALSKAVMMRELRRRSTITRVVLDAAPTPIALLDDLGHPLVANEPMRQCLPLLRERPVPDAADGVVRDEVEDPRSGRLYSRYVARLDHAEVGLHGRIVVLTDVTSEREAERMKDEFFALVSHELRTPLTSIAGYVELLRDEADNPDGDDPRAMRRLQFLGVVDRNARRLLRLVGDLLFVAQVEAGKLSLEEGDVDLEAVARESVEAAGPGASHGGVELILEAAPVPPLRGDRDRLAQALDNLISNAVKFTPDGGRVVLRVLREDDRAVLEVEDTGIGIAQADLQGLFQRFFRTKQATSAAIPGVGLGLTIAQAIVHGHEGHISVRSIEGQGTTFRIELPLHRVAEVPA